MDFYRQIADNTSMEQDNEFGLFVGMRNVLIIYAASAGIAVACIALYKILTGTL